MDNLGPVLGWYLLGIALIVVELFIPGAIVGTAGFLMVLYSLWLAYTQCALWVALSLTAGAMAGIPFILWWGIQRVSIRDAVTSTASLEPALRSLVGRSGTADGLLRPEGAVRIDGRRYDGKAELGYIEAGTEVEVVGVAGAALLVRKKEAGGVPPA